MADKLELQKEILGELVAYSEKIIIGTETVIKELKSTDKTLSINALVELRKDYGMNIEDDEIAKQYSTYVANQLLSANSSN